MGLIDFVLGLKDINVTGNMHVGTLNEEFEKNFGTQIRVYKGLSKGAIQGRSKTNISKYLW